MAKAKSQKRTEAKKNAEALKAKKKLQRQGKTSGNAATKKGRSLVPQSKKK